MDLKDVLGLLHPAIAVALVFPLIGMVINLAWQTRQRRLQNASDSKSKISSVVGPEHLKLGRWLTGSVVGVALLGLAHPIFSKMLANQTWAQEPWRVSFVTLMFLATIASLFLLLQAIEPLWRGIFATLTGAGLVVLGCQPEIFRRGFEWYASHYYFGITAALLMIFSLAIVQDIYKDRSHRWRMVHTILNCLALLLFVGQGVTGSRDLLEIPLSWQEPYIQQLYEQQCNSLPCIISASPAEQSIVPYDFLARH